MNRDSDALLLFLNDQQSLTRIVSPGATHLAFAPTPCHSPNRKNAYRRQSASGRDRLRRGPRAGIPLCVDEQKEGRLAPGRLQAVSAHPQDGPVARHGGVCLWAPDPRRGPRPAHRAAHLAPVLRNRQGHRKEDPGHALVHARQRQHNPRGGRPGREGLQGRRPPEIPRRRKNEPAPGLAEDRGHDRHQGSQGPHGIPRKRRKLLDETNRKTQGDEAMRSVHHDCRRNGDHPHATGCELHVSPIKRQRQGQPALCQPDRRRYSRAQGIGGTGQGLPGPIQAALHRRSTTHRRVVEIFRGIHQQGNDRETLPVQRVFQEHAGSAVRSSPDAKIRLLSQPGSLGIHQERLVCLLDTTRARLV